MKTSIPCPSCQEPITIEHFENFSTPFSMKCPHCKAKLRETKMTPLLFVIAVFVIPLMLFLGITVKNFLVGFFPIVDKVPTIFVFMAFCYLPYALYEAFNATIIMNRGNLQLKNKD
ncbi:hypothetical protein [Bacillus sp. FJAT-22090]|uniref:hypothetical protein n=1 Tax=Bacillus sp. FJAT-22090 TaxID=1581038 RepID=UPI0011AA321D|nr:hypothetical protein [Bacillus sp. FJAT-22090]